METCYLVDPGDILDLRDAIDYLWANPSQAERIGLNARRLVESRYNARTLAQNLQQHVLEIVA
jgi:glycosyltransferase involved in cell wall biosynthesis